MDNEQSVRRRGIMDDELRRGSSANGWLTQVAKRPYRNPLYRIGGPIVYCTLFIILSSFNFHPFHTSLTQMQYDPKSQTFEMSVRVFTDDFETALTKENGGKPVQLNSGQKQDKLVEQYIRKHVAVANADRKQNPITYIGYEQEADAQ